jgi:hypothetical protein
VRLEKGGEWEEGIWAEDAAPGCVCSAVRRKLLCHGDGKERVPNSENGRLAHGCSWKGDSLWPNLLCHLSMWPVLWLAANSKRFFFIFLLVCA